MGVPVTNQDLLSNLKNRILGKKYRNLYHEAIQASMQEKIALLIAEPPSVCPRNLDKEMHTAFKKVFTWDRSLVDQKKYIHALLPVAAVFPKVELIPFSERKMLVDISGNKYSTHERELYSERRNVIKFFELNFPADFDLFGTGWNSENYKRRILPGRLADQNTYASYRGPASHKSQILPRYKFAICYENIAGQIDFVTNRIFDVLRCNCVPIYLGAPNITDYVDRDAFVDRREFSSNNDLAKHISSLSEKKYKAILEAGKSYLENEKFKQFLSNRWVDLIINALDLRKHLG
jgi:hypothetical protein